MSKSVCIFIRTYPPDLPWLKWCLKSLEANWRETEYSTEIVISCDSVCLPAIEELKCSIPTRACAEEQWEDGYIFQQYVKLRADLYTEADVILFLDSDNVVMRPISVRDFGQHSRITMPFDYYRTLGKTVPWQQVVTEVMGRSPDKEYMRRFPILHWRDAIRGTRFHIESTHRRPLDEILRARPLRSMSEFNCIGFWCEIAMPNKYWFVESRYNPNPEPIVKQFHSYTEDPEVARLAYEMQAAPVYIP